MCLIDSVFYLVLAGTLPKYPLHFWRHFFTGPATRRKGVLLTVVLGSAAVIAIAAVGQNQLAAQLTNMVL